MNEVVKDLAARAGYGNSSDPYERQAFDIQMFVDSIVEECLNVLCNKMDENSIDLSDLSKFYLSMDQTTDHFNRVK